MATPTPAQLAIATLYTAAFNRAPDASGFDFWMQAYQQGASLNVLAGTFLGTPEGQAEYPSAMSSQDFVSAFYTSVFGRAADAGGLEFWSTALDALGGAGNADAKAALMVSIIGVASTPLDGQPAGLSDEAYAQTVADRAQFVNKAEVGVYFAVELRSNDVSLAKQVLALVTADPASVNTATAFADQASNPAPVTPPVTPPVIVPALTSADDATTIASKLAAYAGSAASADTTNMDAEQLKALAAGAGKFKVDGFTGTPIFSSDLLVTDVFVLLSKYSGSTATVDASGFTSTQLALLSESLDKLTLIQQPSLALTDAWLTPPLLYQFLIKSTEAQLDTTGFSNDHLTALFSVLANLADDGLTGDLFVPSVVGADMLDLLFQKTTAAATVSVDASFMPVDRLVSLFTNADKIDSVSNLSVLAGVWAELPSDIGTLFSKGTDIHVDLTGASTDQLKGVAAYTVHYAVDGLTGSYTLDRNLDSDQLGALLDNRVATAATVTVQAADMTSAQLLAVAQGIVKADEIVGLSLDATNTVGLSNIQIASLLSKATDVHVDVSNLGASILAVLVANVHSLASDALTGALALSSAVTAAEAGVLLATYGGSTATADAVDMDADYLAVLAGASTKFAVGSIATPTLLVGNVLLDDTVTETLLARSTGAQVVATDATAAELLSVVNHIGNVASGGIQGTFALQGNLNAAQLTSLLGKLDADARVTADVSAMQAGQLAVLAAKPLALNAGALTGSLNLSAPLTATAVAVLLNRYAGTDASLLATGVGSDVLNAAAATLGKVASISGELEILADVIPGYGLLLLDKYVDDTATVDASLFNSTQLQSLYASLDKLTTITQPTLVLADAWLTPTVMDNLLAKSVDAQIIVTGADSAHLTNLLTKLPNIAADGIVGTLAISASTADAAYLDALLEKTAVAATVSVNAASMDVDQIVLLFTHAAKIDTFTNLSVPSGVWAQLPADIGKLFTKAINIRADLTGASAAQLKGVAQTPWHFAAGGLTGTFALDQSFDASQLGILLGSNVNSTAEVTVNAAGMDVDQVVALFANAANVDHLTNLSAPSGTMAQIGSNFGLLFTKGIGSSVDLTGATAQQLGVIGQFVNQIKSDGLTGSFTITKDVNEGYYDALLGSRVANAANVTVQAIDLSAAQLAAVVQGIGKVDTILGLSLTDSNTSGLTATNIAGLLSKSSGADASALSSTMLADALVFVADGVVKGMVGVGVAQFMDVGVTRFENKLAATATLSITGSGGDDVIDLTNFTKQTYVVGGAGADMITLGSGKGTVLIGGKVDSRSTAVVDTTQSTSASIDRIAGLKAGDVIKLSLADGVFGSGIQFAAATNLTYVEQRSQNVTVGPATFDNIYNALSGFVQTASTSALASLQIFTLTSTSGLAGKFLIINDGNEAITADDTIIELIGATDDLVFTV